MDEELDVLETPSLTLGGMELEPAGGISIMGERMTIGFIDEGTPDEVLSMLTETNLQSITYEDVTYTGYTELVELRYRPADKVYSVVLRRDEQKEAVAEVISRLDLTDEQALTVSNYYPIWTAGTDYTAGQRVRYEGVLYNVLQAHTSQSDWTPADAPSLFARVLIDEASEEIPEWIQPDSTNPYRKGDVVMHNQIKWESLIDGNVWEPNDTNVALGLWLRMD